MNTDKLHSTKHSSANPDSADPDSANLHSTNPNSDRAPSAADISGVSELFKLFGDGTRVSILAALADKEHCVCELSDRLAMTGSAVSHQLRLLRSGGLVAARRDGKHIFYSLADSHVETILAQGFEHIRE